MNELFCKKVDYVEKAEKGNFDFGPMTAELVFGKEIASLKAQYDAACKEQQEKEGELNECETKLSRYAFMDKDSLERDVYEEWKKFLRMLPSDSCYVSTQKLLLGYSLTRQYIELTDCLKELEVTKKKLEATMLFKMFVDTKEKE